LIKKPRAHRLESLAQFQAHVLKIRRNPKCLIGIGTDKACQNPTVNSHTIAKCWLREIATDGHVLWPLSDPISLEKNGGKLTLKPSGISNASAYPLFCAEHDSKLFKPIENCIFNASAESANLLFFRALTREFYAKANASRALSSIEFDLDGTPNALADMSEFEKFKFSIDIGLQDILQYFAPATKRVIENEPANMSYLNTVFDVILPFSYVACISPEFSFSGEPLNNLASLGTHPEIMGISCFNSGGVGHLSFSWIKGTDTCRSFAKSFHALSRTHKAQAALAIGVEYIENIAFSPSWWSGIPLGARKSLLNRLQTSGSPHNERHASSLSIDQIPLLDAQVSTSKTNDGALALFY